MNESGKATPGPWEARQIEYSKGLDTSFEVVAINIDTRDTEKPKAFLKEIGVTGSPVDVGPPLAGIGGRDYDEVDLSDSQLWNVYLKPFKAAVDAGAGNIMSAYMGLNGVPATGKGFAIYLAPEDRAIGSSRFMSIAPEHRRVEIGWTWLNPSAWRTGANQATHFSSDRDLVLGSGAEATAVVCVGREAAISAVRSNDPAVWKAFIDSNQALVIGFGNVSENQIRRGLCPVLVLRARGSDHETREHERFTALLKPVRRSAVYNALMALLADDAALASVAAGALAKIGDHRAFALGDENLARLGARLIEQLFGRRDRRSA